MHEIAGKKNAHGTPFYTTYLCATSPSSPTSCSSHPRTPFRVRVHRSPAGEPAFGIVSHRSIGNEELECEPLC